MSGDVILSTSTTRERLLDTNPTPQTESKGTASVLIFLLRFFKERINENNTGNEREKGKMVIRKSSNKKILKPDELYKQEKLKKIASCLEKKEVDLWLLRELCLCKGGLINAEQRRRAWHKLLGINRVDLDQIDGGFSLEEGSVSAQDRDLIERDVGRAVYFRYKLERVDNATSSSSTVSQDEQTAIEICPSAGGDFNVITDVTTVEEQQPIGDKRSTTMTTDCCSDEDSCADDSPSNDNFNISAHPNPTSPSTVTEQRDMLSNLIISSINLPTNPKFHTQKADVATSPHRQRISQNTLNYYQGFHDVASIIFFTLPQSPQQASLILRKIAKSNLRDAMHSDFSRVTTLLEIAFFPLLQALDEELHDFLVFCELGPTVFLTWIVTLFAHDVHNSEDACRLMDAFIASHALMPLYLSMAILVHPKSREMIFETESEDPGMVHIVVTGLVKGLKGDFDASSQEEGFTIQDLIDDAISFMRKIPPDSLLKFAKDYDLGQNTQVLKCAKTVSVFNPPPSYNLESYAPSDWVQRKQKKEAASKKMSSLKRASVSGSKDVLQKETSVTRRVKKEKSNEYVNAKIACGVTSIMETVNASSRKTKRSFNVKKPTPFLTAKTIVGLFKVVFGVQKISKRKRIFQ